ncbi:TPA: ParM/StbA family protein [Bacillus thuringiensis]|nr:ParM/StbA family protein [Bacillus thuringiensis]
MTNLLIIGLESANSFSKSFSNAKKNGYGLKYYNTASEILDKHESIASNALSNVFTVNVNDKDRKYKVGSAEGTTSSGQSSIKYNEQYKTETLITIYRHIEAMNNQDSIVKVVAVIGLPTVHYRNEEIEKQIEGLLLNQKHIVNGRVFEIVDLDFFLQPLGTFYSLIFDHRTLELNRRSKQLLDERYKFLVVDPGFGTLDLTVVQGSEKIDEHSAKYAMGYVINRVKQKAIEKNPSFKSLNMQPLEIDRQISEAIKNDEQRIEIGQGVHKVDVTEIVKEEFNELAKKIVKEMDLPEYSFDQFEGIVLTGGTSIALQEDFEKLDDSRFIYVQKEFEEKFTQEEYDGEKPDAQLANAIGYYIQACSNAEDVLEKA